MRNQSARESNTKQKVMEEAKMREVVIYSLNASY